MRKIEHLEKRLARLEANFSMKTKTDVVKPKKFSPIAGKFKVFARVRKALDTDKRQYSDINSYRKNETLFLVFKCLFILHKRAETSKFISTEYEPIYKTIRLIAENRNDNGKLNFLVPYFEKIDDIIKTDAEYIMKCKEISAKIKDTHVTKPPRPVSLDDEGFEEESDEESDEYKEQEELAVKLKTATSARAGLNAQLTTKTLELMESIRKDVFDELEANK
jgi:hypothetical protein